MIAEERKIFFSFYCYGCDSRQWYIECITGLA